MGRDGKGREEKGWEGKGREGKGGEGKGREGKGREGTEREAIGEEGRASQRRANLGIQAAESLAEEMRKHGEHHLHEIGRSRPCLCILVQRRPFPHKEADIGDMYPDLFRQLSEGGVAGGQTRNRRILTSKPPFAVLFT
eukprot:760416-Hanusia_phi.AAC.1